MTVKHVIAGVLLLMQVLHVRAQGFIEFNNRFQRDVTTGTVYDAPVSLPNGTRAAGEAFTAGLFVVGPDSSLSLVGTTPFRTGIAAGFIVSTGFPVPGTLPGSPATFRARVWETAAGSYESAVQSG